MGVTLTTCGEIPETGTAPLGGRFLLVTDAQENGCGTYNRRHLGLMDREKQYTCASFQLIHLCSEYKMNLKR